jgi:hypothetical protein
MFLSFFKGAAYAQVLSDEDRKDKTFREENSDSCVQVANAKICVLNKITAKREIFIINADSEIHFGSLNIKILECWKVLDPFRPDNLAFIEIYEKSKPKGRTLIFRGWMSSTNPGHAILEHYAYAVAVLECF